MKPKYKLMKGLKIWMKPNTPCNICEYATTISFSANTVTQLDNI